MVYTYNCTIDSSIINDFRTIHILTKKSRFTPVVRLLFFCCQRTKEVQNHGKTLDSRRISDYEAAVSERGREQISAENSEPNKHCHLLQGDALRMPETCPKESQMTSCTSVRLEVY